MPSGPPSRRAARVLLLAVLIASAGCGGSGDPDDGTGRTLTPAPLPGDATAAGGDELAPGIDRTGVYDPARLAAAHARRLANVSYTAERHVTRRRPGGTVVERIDRVVRVAADRSRYRYRVVLRRPGGDRVVGRYADGERIYARTVTPDDTTYRLVRAPDGGPLAPREASFGRATGRRGLVRLFARLDFALAGRTRRDGRTYYRLVTEAAEGTADRVPERGVRGTLLVGERGLVREYHLAYRTNHGGRERVVTVDVRFHGIGTTAVGRPAWYDDARRAVGTAPTPTPVPDPTRTPTRSSRAPGGPSGGSSRSSSAGARP